MNILHKLGLYRASEVEELIAKTAALTNSVDGVVEEARDSKECYKVALRMFNEAQTVEHAVKVISEYCDSADCTECDFNKRVCKYADACKHFYRGKCHSDIPCEHSKTLNCEFAYRPPCNWRVER